MGWCSYLLIGHWSRARAARRAAHKAFLVTRLADVGFVLGVVLLAQRGSRGSRHTQRRSGTGSRSAAPPSQPLTPDHRCSPSACSCSSSASLGKSAHGARSTTGCPTRWRVPTPRPPSSTPRRWWRPGTVRPRPAVPAARPATAARVLLAVSTAVTMVLAAVARVRPVRPQAPAGLLDAEPGRDHAAALAVAPRRAVGRRGRRRAPLLARLLQGTALPHDRLAGVLAGGTAAKALRGSVRGAELSGGLPLRAARLAGRALRSSASSRRSGVVSGPEGAQAGDPAGVAARSSRSSPPSSSPRRTPRAPSSSSGPHR